MSTLIEKLKAVPRPIKEIVKPFLLGLWATVNRGVTGAITSWQRSRTAQPPTGTREW